MKSKEEANPVRRIPSCDLKQFESLFDDPVGACSSPIHYNLVTPTTHQEQEERRSNIIFDHEEQEQKTEETQEAAFLLTSMRSAMLSPHLQLPALTLPNNHSTCHKDRMDDVNTETVVLSSNTQDASIITHSSHDDTQSARLRAVSLDSQYLHSSSSRHSHDDSQSHPDPNLHISLDLTKPSLNLIDSSSLSTAVKVDDDRISTKKNSRTIDRRKKYIKSNYSQHTTTPSASDSSDSSIVDNYTTTPSSNPSTTGTLSSSDKPTNTKTILRKKFTWKNYPELESFLIVNREEYLRHSALNYTMQQKQYNNRLTERLLELASDTGYVFDQDDFSFSTVRDRIRCYFKSYVQSRKKRGEIIGYAARKAGLVTLHDLEEGGEGGKIVVPSCIATKNKGKK